MTSRPFLSPSLAPVLELVEEIRGVFDAADAAGVPMAADALAIVASRLLVGCANGRPVVGGVRDVVEVAGELAGVPGVAGGPLVQLLHGLQDVAGAVLASLPPE